MSNFKEKTKIMQESGIEIGNDFQGWPIYKRNWRFIFKELGVLNEDGSVAIDKDNPLLDTYPSIEEDDGMGYSPYSRWITGVQSKINEPGFQIWIDCERKEVPEDFDPTPISVTYPYERLKNDIYIQKGWPEVQNYMADHFDKIYFDPSKNCWFIPAYLDNH